MYDAIMHGVHGQAAWQQGWLQPPDDPLPDRRCVQQPDTDAGFT
jgi:hypothetical protein